MTANVAKERAADALAPTPGGFFLKGQFGGSGPLTTIPINQDRFTIGRHAQNSLCLDDATVSGHHAEILLAGKTCILRDLGSRNGTFLNGIRLQDASVILDGDRLQLGSTVLKLTRSFDETRLGNATMAGGEEAAAIAGFHHLLEDGAIVPHFQALVDMQTQKTWGYEVLGRSRLIGLRSPAEMFRAASQHGAEQELSRLLRMEGVRAADHLPAECALFLNTHPAELAGPGLLESLVALRRRYPVRPLVLEIHEAAVTDVGQLTQLRTGLTELCIGLAFDDFGSGQTRLLELTDVRPEIVKFDARLIRNIHRAPGDKQRVLKSLVDMVLALGIAPLAEGIELEDEAAACRAVGFKLAQGYLFGRPAVASACAPNDLE